MRVRSTTTGSFSTSNIHAKYTLSTNAPQGPYVETFSGKQTIKTVRDVVTPGFHALQKCGAFLPLNPFEIDTTDVTRIAGEGRLDYVGANFYWAGPYVPAFSSYVAIPDIDESLSDSAVLSAAANAAESAFDVSTWLGEFQDTVRTIAEIGRRFNGATEAMANEARNLAEIARLARYPKRLIKYLGNPRNAWHQFCDLWLLGRYGVRPIVYDFYSAQKAMEVLLKGTTIVKGKGTRTESISETYGPVDSNYGGGFYETRSESIVGTRTYYGTAFVKFSDSTTAAFQFNPLVTAWELTPYSFIVDWFVDVGAWLQTLKPQMDGDYLGICLGIKTETEHTSVFHWGSYPPISGGLGPATQITKVKSYTRKSASIPSSPPFVPRLTLPKVIDLVTIFLNGKRRVNYILGR
jgi:hypothetical protein